MEDNSTGPVETPGSNQKAKWILGGILVFIFIVGSLFLCLLVGGAASIPIKGGNSNITSGDIAFLNGLITLFLWPIGDLSLAGMEFMAFPLLFVCCAVRALVLVLGCYLAINLVKAARLGKLVPDISKSQSEENQNP